MKIAVIFCCYNRKAFTERCLKQLYRQIERRSQDTFQIYVFDDGSNDGTVEMIHERFPQTMLMVGEGNCYWCKSMYYGMQEAIKCNYDFYLMINDDVDFCEDAIDTMIESFLNRREICGIVGATKAIETEMCTYGGRDETEELVLPGDNKKCIYTNWNCFLVNREIIDRVGIIDSKYKHACGDYDYSYRMVKMGYSIYVADRYIGRCDLNSSEGSFKDASLSRKMRLKKLFAPKGVPFLSYARYYWRIKGIVGVVSFLYSYLSLVGYILLGKSIDG